MWGELCWASAAGLAPPAPLPSASSPSPSLLLSPACPPRAQEGLAELSSRPGDTAGPRPRPSGIPHLHRASAQRLPTVVFRAPGAQPHFCVCGREQQRWKRCWDITMETASLHRAASVCCPLLSAPAVCQRGSDVAVICFGDKGALHPPALLSTEPLKHCCRNSVPDFHSGCGIS